MNSSVGNKKYLMSINRLVRRAAQLRRFALIFVSCSSTKDQSNYVDELSRSFYEMGISGTTVDLWNRMPIKSLLETIQGHLSEHFSHGVPLEFAIQVVGLEISVLLDKNERFPAVLQSLNHDRELYRKTFPYPVIIWLPDYAYVKLANTAPDFWAVRDGSYVFSSDMDIDTSGSPDAPFSEARDLTIWQDKFYQIPLLERSLEWIQKSEERRIFPTIADLKIKLGETYYYIGRTEKALSFFQEALSLSREPLRDAEREGRALNGIGLAQNELGDLPEAISTFCSYLELSQQAKKRDMEAIGYNHLGLVYGQEENYESAIECYQSALKINREMGRRQEEGDVLGNLGLVYRKLKNYDEALISHNNALIISREMNDLQSEAKDLGNIGLVYHESQDYETAIEYYRQALRLHQESGDKRDELNQLINLGDAWRDLDSLTESYQNYFNAYTIAQDIGYGELTVLEKLVNLPSETIHMQEEISWIEKMIARSCELENWELQFQYMDYLIDIYRRRGAGEEKREYLLRLEGLTRYLLEESENLEKLIYYEKLIDIYDELGQQEKTEEYRWALERLKITYPVRVWLESPDLDVHTPNPVLYVNHTYLFHAQIGPPHPKNSKWLDEKILKFKKIQPPTLLEKREGVKVTIDTTAKRHNVPLHKSQLPSLGQDKPLPLTGTSIGYSESLLNSELYSDAENNIPNERDSIEIELSSAISVSLQFRNGYISHDTLRVTDTRDSSSLVFTITPKIPGDYRLSITVKTKGQKYQDKFDIDLTTIEDTSKSVPIRDIYLQFARSRPLQAGDPRYVDCFEERGMGSLIERMRIPLFDSPRPLFFSGHIGDGVTTILNQLRTQLEGEDNDFVVIGQASDLLDLSDVECDEVLLTMLVIVDQALRERYPKMMEANPFQQIWETLAHIEQLPVEYDKGELDSGLFWKLTATVKDSPDVRSLVRESFKQARSQTSLLEVVNQYLAQAQEMVRSYGHRQLVVILDGFDRLLATGSIR